MHIAFSVFPLKEQSSQEALCLWGGHLKEQSSQEALCLWGGQCEFPVTFEDSQCVAVCEALARPLAWPLGDSAACLSGWGAPGRGTGATDHRFCPIRCRRKTDSEREGRD